jgi:hypothetical protein
MYNKWKHILDPEIPDTEDLVKEAMGRMHFGSTLYKYIDKNILTTYLGYLAKGNEDVLLKSLQMPMLN